MKTISLSVQKGGSGKTTTVYNIASELAAAGKSVLMVDLDPQGTLTGISDADDEYTIADVIGGKQKGTKTISEVIQPVRERLDIVPAGIDLSVSEINIASRYGREEILKKALESVQDDYDFCIIDTPPSLSLLTGNALAAADGVIIPIQPTAADIWGLSLFLDTMAGMTAETNPKLSVIGILLTFYDGRTTLHQNALHQLESSPELPPVLPVRITRSVKIAEAAGAHKSLREYDPKNPNNKSYALLAEELIKWR